MRHVEGHPDFERLERRLVELVCAAKAEGPLGPLTPILIVVPTARLKSHLQRLLAGEFGALFEATVLHHAALATRAATAAGVALPRLIPPRVRDAILHTCLDRSFERIASWIDACPGGLKALRASMDDLRDAGVVARSAHDLPELSRRGREMLHLYSLYEAAIDRLIPLGLADDAGRTGIAAHHAAAFALRFHAVIHYGAYELIGSNLALMRAVESAGRPVTWLVPCHPEAPAYAYARRFVESSLGTQATLLPDGAPSGRLLGERLRLLYDEDAASTPPVEGGCVRFFHAQGAATELREAGLRILSAAGKGATGDLSRTAIVARSLEPYVPWLDPVLRDELRIPFSTRAARGALEDPHALAAHRLAEAALEDYERQPLLDLARTGLLKLPGEGANGVDEAPGWDMHSRRFRIARGRDGWTRDLRRQIESWFSGILDGDPEKDNADDPAFRERALARRAAWLASAGTLAQLIDSLERGASAVRKATSWTGWAEAFEAFAAERLEGFGAPSGGSPRPPGAEAVFDALAGMRMLDDATIPFAGREALEWFKRAVSEARICLDGSGSGGGAADRGGLRVLSAEQARGLAFDRLFLIGFNADLIPRRPREDPFLFDADRSLLRERLSVAMPVKSAGREEEHLLLAHLLGAARGEVTISWQRADESGRARVPSLALREVARIVLGEADPSLPLQPEHSLRIPAHPSDLAADTRDRLGLMAPGAARIGAALHGGGPAGVAAMAGALPDSADPPLTGNLTPGLKLLEAVESFEAANLSYDGFVGSAAPPRDTWSPTQLERMGNCALHYFFNDVLKVRPLDDLLAEHELDRSEMGQVAHAVLRDIYRALIDEGALSGPAADPPWAARRAVELMEPAWAGRADAMAARMHLRYPLLWRSLSGLWKNALQTFLLHDIVDLERQEARIVGLEHEVRAEVRVREQDEPIRMHGRFDRLVRSGDGAPVVADYKTGGNLESRVNLSQMLKGIALQLPLYVLMEEAEARAQGREIPGVAAEVIGIGPAFSEGSPATDPRPEGYPARETLDPVKFGKYRDGLAETLRILKESADAGRFPLNPATSWCAWCPYARACRSGHAPTIARLESAPEARGYLALGGKSIRRPLLDGGGAGGGEGS